MKEFIFKYRKQILYVAIALILFFLIRRNWYKVKRLWQTRNLTAEPGEGLTISPERKMYLENLASLIYKDIYDTPLFGHQTDLYKQANSLSDSELLYLSRYYKRQLSSGSWLYDDIDDEVFALDRESDVDTKLMAHLAKIGER